MPRVFCKSGPKSQKPNPVFPPHSRCHSVLEFSSSAVPILNYWPHLLKKTKKNKSCVVLCRIQTCSHCTRSSTCGTRCCWAIPPSPFALVWPYCSSWGTDSWPTASTNASCCSQTCQVRRCTGVYDYERCGGFHRFFSAAQLQASRWCAKKRKERKNLVSFMNRNWSLSLCISSRHCRRLFFSRPTEDLWPACGNLSNSVWASDIPPKLASLLPLFCRLHAAPQCSSHSVTPSLLLHRRDHGTYLSASEVFRPLSVSWQVCPSQSINSSYINIALFMHYQCIPKCFTEK